MGEVAFPPNHLEGSLVFDQLNELARHRVAGQGVRRLVQHSPRYKPELAYRVSWDVTVRGF